MIAVHGNYMAVVCVVGATFVVWSIEDGAMYCRRGKICWAKRSGFQLIPMKFSRKYFYISLARSAYFLREVLIFTEKLSRYS